jgi:nitroreductase
MEQPQERPLSALDAIFTRRSVRSYTGQKLDEPTIRGLLDAAVQAPTAMHEEPWAFVVIQDDATLKRYSDLAKGTWAKEVVKYRDLHIPGDAAMGASFADQFANPEFCIFYNAGTLIVICAKPMGPFVTADCWLAAENLMLAACAMGLGTCCIGSAVPALNTPDVKAELGIPVDVTAVAPIIVGVPSGNAAATLRKDVEILSWK